MRMSLRRWVSRWAGGHSVATATPPLWLGIDEVAVAGLITQLLGDTTVCRRR